MNNLHRELAPISAAAWIDMETELSRTFIRYLGGRRLVDVPAPAGPGFAGAPTGHLEPIDAPQPGVTAALRGSVPAVEFEVAFTVTRAAVDSIERGAQDADWQPAKDAARKLAFAEDKAIFHGFAAARTKGIITIATNPSQPLPDNPREYPDAVAHALSTLKLAGVNGPYALALSADAYAKASESSDEGYPIFHHLRRIVDGEIVWVPALDGAVVLTTRGGDYELRVGTDLSVGYSSHDDSDIRLYLRESFAFLPYTSEAAVHLTSSGATRQNP
ncbi:family 1 encapsulin nanocompartment shell protein [Nonomuraea longicatena]|uniref:Type 1 encapsulin shell protein n=1 Tax=Nonomuraea longicatena TaxID=83682 RepID=A0ABP4AHG2_9ACTN